MSNPAPTSPANRLADLRRGLGEVASFLASGVRAVVQFCLGQWPDYPPKEPPAVRHPVKDLAENLGPYPTQD
jgi:hypothetical protein